VAQDTKGPAGKGQAPGISGRVVSLIPGIALCGLITLVSIGVQHVEERYFDHPYVEALVIAILLGMAVRTAWQPSVRWLSGIAFSAKQLLEVAVMLLGASVSFAAVMASGLALIAAIIATVAIMLAVSYGLSRMLGLSTKLSILIACGNSICGNSAIAAVAPVIGADGDDIASSISFTAILGVLMVLGLPLLIPLLELSATQYGILAGLTVYAVPQVLAATVPAGIVSTQIGTLVKLVRVLMLGPIVVALSLVAAQRRKRNADATKAPPISPFKLVPWFIIGFLLLALLRSAGVIPARVASQLKTLSSWLTLLAMAALGLGVDLRALRKVGAPVVLTVCASLVAIVAMSVVLIRMLAIR
jgi:uncharacterized integral membrane protein (TIGR00698 family)